MVSRVIARPLELVRDNIRRESPIEEYKLAMHNHGLLIILRWDVSRVKLMLLAKFALPRVIFSFSLSLPFSVRNTWVVKKFPTQLLRVRKPMRSVCRYFPHVVSRLMDPPWRRVSHGPWSKRFVFVFRSRWLRLCDEARRAPWDNNFAVNRACYKYHRR